MTQSKRSLTAVKLRILLASILALLVAGGIGLFVYGYGKLDAYSEDISRKQADADASQNSLTNLQTLQQQLERYSDVSPLLERLTAQGDLPQFEAEANLRTIARNFNVSVTNITFVNNEPTSPRTGAAAAAPQQPSNVAQITFEFANPISYPTLLNFLNAIETSTPKMQINAITLPSQSSRSSVQPGQLILQLSIR